MYETQVLCLGETAETTVAGRLETMIPVEVGHIHTIKGRRWKCYYKGLNGFGKPLAEFKPLN